MMAEQSWNGDRSETEALRAIARVEFLGSVAALEPAVLGGLRDDVLPAYLAAYEDVAACQTPELLAERYRRYEQDHDGRVRFCHNPLNVSRWRTVGRAAVTEDSAVYPELVPLREAVEAWSDQWSLSQAWIQETALAQLEWWRQHPAKAATRRRLSWFPLPALKSGAQPRVREQRSGAEGRSWDPTCQLDWWQRYPARPAGPGRLSWLPLPVVDPGVSLQARERRFTYEHPGWDPARETRKAAQSAMVADFEKRLKAHLDALEARVVAAKDFERSETYREMCRRLEWLVLYQVKELNFSEIGRRAHVNSRTVAKGIRTASELVEVELRPVRRGAPKRRRTRQARTGTEE